MIILNTGKYKDKQLNHSERCALKKLKFSVMLISSAYCNNNKWLFRTWIRFTSEVNYFMEQNKSVLTPNISQLV